MNFQKIQKNLIGNSSGPGAISAPNYHTASFASIYVNFLSNSFNSAVSSYDPILWPNKELKWVVTCLRMFSSPLTISSSEFSLFMLFDLRLKKMDMWKYVVLASPSFSYLYLARCLQKISSLVYISMILWCISSNWTLSFQLSVLPSSFSNSSILFIIYSFWLFSSSKSLLPISSRLF